MRYRFIIEGIVDESEMDADPKSLCDLSHDDVTVDFFPVMKMVVSESVWD